MDRRDFMKWFALSPVVGQHAVREQVNLLQGKIPSMVGLNSLDPPETCIASDNNQNRWIREGFRGLINRWKKDEKTQRLTIIMVRAKAEDNIRFNNAFTNPPVLRGAPPWLIKKMHIEAEVKYIFSLYPERFEEADLITELCKEKGSDEADSYAIRRIIGTPWNY